MKQLLFSFCILNAFISVSAQDSTYVTIKAGTNIIDVLTPPDIYFYPQFTSGKVFFRDGAKAVAPMNYSRLFQQMLFIDANGDTLALTDEKNIRFITAGTDTFFYDDGYLQLIAKEGDVKLLEKQVWVVADIRKIGTHNRPATTFAVTSFSSLYNEKYEPNSRNLILNEDLILRKETQYYFGNEYNQFVPAAKLKLQKLFPKMHQDIEVYLRENKVSFENKEDLNKLTQYIGRNN